MPALTAEEARAVAQIAGTVWFLVVSAGLAIRGYGQREIDGAADDARKHVINHTADLLGEVKREQ